MLAKLLSKRVSVIVIILQLLLRTGVGCADLHIEGWLRQDKNRAMIFCNATGDKWYLTCEDNVWRGARRNCSYGNVYT